MKSSITLRGQAVAVIACASLMLVNGCSERDSNTLAEDISNESASRSQPITADHMKYRIFADNYQFHLVDKTLDPFEGWSGDVTDEDMERGNLVTDNAVWIFTSADLNDHRLDFIIVDEFPEPVGEGKSVYQGKIKTPSKSLGLAPPDDDKYISVSSDLTDVFVVKHNAGIEHDGEMSDEEILKRNDLERYEVYVKR